MSVAVRLRCSCRRRLATLDHGERYFVVSERERFGLFVELRPFTPGEDIPNDQQEPHPVAAGMIPVDRINGASVRCSACHAQRSFRDVDLDEAIERAQITGRPVDIVVSA